MWKQNLENEEDEIQERSFAKTFPNRNFLQTREKFPAKSRRLSLWRHPFLKHAQIPGEIQKSCPIPSNFSIWRGDSSAYFNSTGKFSESEAPGVFSS